VTSRPLLAFEHVSREFDGGRVVAVRDVNLEIAKGESLSLVGPSGSGKPHSC
jgi:ABC-type Fe3+/spermidine/putrescine transport system ATPase subunit